MKTETIELTDGDYNLNTMVLELIKQMKLFDAPEASIETELNDEYKFELTIKKIKRKSKKTKNGKKINTSK